MESCGHVLLAPDAVDLTRPFVEAARPHVQVVARRGADRRASRAAQAWRAALGAPGKFSSRYSEGGACKRAAMRGSVVAVLASLLSLAAVQSEVRRKDGGLMQRAAGRAA